LPRVSVPLELEIVAAPTSVIWPLSVLFPEAFCIAPTPDTPDPAIENPFSLIVMLFCRARVAPDDTDVEVPDPSALLLVAKTVPAFTAKEFEKELLPESVRVPAPLL